MAGRVPAGSSRAAVAAEMETIFVQNLKYAANVFSKVGDRLSIRSKTGLNTELMILLLINSLLPQLSLFKWKKETF